MSQSSVPCTEHSHIATHSPSGDVDHLPEPAVPLPFRLGHAVLGEMQNTLAFLWDSHLIGAERTYPARIISPYGMRFDQQEIDGRTIENGVLYNASLRFDTEGVGNYQSRLGDLYFTFFEGPRASRSGGYLSSDPYARSPSPPSYGMTYTPVELNGLSASPVDSPQGRALSISVSPDSDTHSNEATEESPLSPIDVDSDDDYVYPECSTCLAANRWHPDGCGQADGTSDSPSPAISPASDAVEPSSSQPSLVSKLTNVQDESLSSPPHVPTFTVLSAMVQSPPSSNPFLVHGVDSLEHRRVLRPRHAPAHLFKKPVAPTPQWRRRTRRVMKESLVISGNGEKQNGNDEERAYQGDEDTSMSPSSPPRKKIRLLLSSLVPSPSYSPTMSPVEMSSEAD